MDRRDQMIIEELQKDSSLSQRELAEKVNLSQNACWRRLQNLRESGVIEGSTVRLTGISILLPVNNLAPTNE